MSVDLSQMSASAPAGSIATAPSTAAPIPASSARSGSASMVEAAVGTAKTVLDRSVTEVRNFIEQNPSQVRATVFLMGLAQAVYCALGIVNIFALSFTPVEYMVNLYLCVFAVITLVLEGKPEWPGVQTVQEKIFFQAHFLSTVHGRAGFYLFQGTFGMARYETDLLMFVFGVGFFAIGSLILFQSYKSRNADGSLPRENLLRDYHTSGGGMAPPPQNSV
mmetsp:Transcript_23933/g.60404  ORF Transcript_23933/g.60404 Transcript_23933/m.60404 type:complete len:220 (+) Transcript_23933:308-967(+)